MKRSLALLGLLLASAGVAAAQDVPFETIARGAHGGYGPPANHVVRSQAELQSTGVDKLLPPGTSIDFSKDMLLAVLMGTKNTGGYSVEVTKIERKQMMTILPVPAPPPTYYLEVQADHRSPPPGSIVTMALTSPYHVVKVRKTSERVDFVASAPAFTSVQRNVRWPGGISNISIAADGAVHTVTGQITHHANIVDGAATVQELRALSDALRAADFASIPADITPSSIPVGGRLYTLTVDGATPHAVRAAWGLEGAYAARLRLVHDAIDAIFQRVITPPAPFSVLTFDLTKGLTSHGASLFLMQDGSATVQRTQPNALIAPVHGQLTAAELDAVRTAVKDARLASIPESLPTPIHIVAGDTFTVEVASDDAALAGKTRGEPGYLQQYDARLRPLLDACTAIIDRIAPEAPQVEEAKGIVRVSGNSVSLFESAQRIYRLSGPAKALAAKFPGKTVKVEGKTLSVSGPITRFEASAILYPSPITDGSVQVQPGATVRFFLQGQRLRRVTGPAAAVLRAFPGRSHVVDGYLFEVNATPDELYVAAVAAEAKQFSPLFRNGQWAGYVTKGQKVEVLAISGTDALVRAGSRTGYLRLSRLEVGEVPVPLHGPTPGLTGSVPGQ
jgi:hypothetical protein